MSRICPSCKQDLPLEAYYYHRLEHWPSFYCKTCTNRQTMDRQLRLKQQACEYKGGRCQRCGYDRCLGALEFHRLDPAAKDFHLAKAKLTNFEKVRSELDKCVLLCANCHREEHARLKGLKQ